MNLFDMPCGAKWDQIFFSSGSTFFSYDVDTGDINWKNEVHSVATPIIDGKNIFIVTENGYVRLK